jgi:hypothetical protein
MKKVLLLLVLVLLTISCSIDADCKELYDVYQKVESRSNSPAVLLISEDTCIESAGEYTQIRINGDSVLTITGDDVVVGASVIITDNGTLNVEESLIISNDIFFLGDNGTVNVGKGLVMGHAVRGGNDCAITYCTFASIQILDAGISSTQVCDAEFDDCQTLSDDSVQGFRYLGREERDCDFQGDDGDFRYIKVD